MVTYRLIILLFGLFGLLAACDDNAEDGDEYVKTAKGDIVRKREADAANLPTRLESSEDESADDERDE